MAKIFSPDAFIKGLANETESQDDLSEVLINVSPEKMDEAKKALSICLRIMKAQKLEELQDLSLDDFLLAFQNVDLFYRQLVDGRVAADYYQNITSVLPTLKNTLVKRRVL